jgi:hypothetical protein
MTTLKNKLKIAFPALFLLLITGCSTPSATSKETLAAPLPVISTSKLNCPQDTIGYFVYNIKDTLSTLFISYHECTECLDAQKDSGDLYIDETIRQKLIEIDKKRGPSFIPNGQDLYLTGEKNIAATLFGDSVNYGEHWHDRFIITGKIVDIKGLGFVFRVDTYKKL